jgi:hypothetical protein
MRIGQHVIEAVHQQARRAADVVLAEIGGEARRACSGSSAGRRR